MYYKKIQILIFINICISICWWKFSLIQHLTHKICNLIFACCNARSQHLRNCLTTPPFRASCFTQHPAAQSHPLSFAWEILPWFYLLLSSPALRARFLDPKSLNPLPWPWEGEILEQLPSGRWQESLQLVWPQVFIGAAASPELAWEPRTVQQLQLSHSKAKPWVTESSSSSCHPKLYL